MGDSWFVMQGLNLANCAPAVGASLVNRAGGRATVSTARRFLKSGFWTLDTIYRYLRSQNVNAHIIRVNHAGLRTAMNDGATLVLYVRIFLVFAHFRIIVHNPENTEQVDVYDPLTGKSTVFVDTIPNTLINTTVIRVN